MEAPETAPVKKGIGTGTVIGIIAGVIVLGGVAYLIYRLSKNTSNAGTGTGTGTVTPPTVITTKANAIAQIVKFNSDMSPNVTGGIGGYDELFLIAWANATLGTEKSFTYNGKKYSTYGGFACTTSNPCV